MSEHRDWLPGGGEMGERTRSMDWSRTSLGPVSDWPRSLRTIVTVILTSRHPMFLWWGPDLIQFYNDGYRSSLGQDRHPAALGAYGRDFWAEIWEAIGPQIEAVLQRGESTWNEDHLVPITRDNRLQEVYWTYSYSPVLDDEGRIGGVLVTVQETTKRIQSERRMGTLRMLADRTSAEGRSSAEVCRVAVDVLTGSDADIAFALIYLIEEDGTLRLGAQVGDLPDRARPDELITADSAAMAGWSAPVSTVAGSGRMEVLADLPDRLGALPGGRWPEPADAAVILPIIRAGQDRPSGVLVAGVSPRQAFDQPYREFFELLAAQLATSLANARTHQEEARARREMEEANRVLLQQEEALRESEERYRAMTEALREADRMKDEFLATLSHELRTPLTAILGWTQILLASEHPHEQMMLGIETISRSAKAQSRLIEDVLDVSRITTGKMRLDRKPTDLSRVVEAALETVQSAADAKEIHLQLSADRGIVPLLVDPDRVQQIVWNLLSNAIKFSAPRTTVRVTLRRENGQAIIEVRDEGPGIAKEFLPHLFERFRQADSSSRRSYSGLGLGLALTKNLTELHGGTIEVESELDRGSLFRVSLPIVGSETETSDTPREAESATPDFPLAGIKVLFVDDSADSRTLFHTMLQSNGAQVATAGSVDEALASLRQRPADVVITDVAMPGRDGYDLLREIRSLEGSARLPVLALTAQARSEDEQRARAAGFQSYLRKPIDTQALVQEIARQVERSEPHRDPPGAL